MTKSELIKVYTSMVRPVAEYVTVVWHSSITKEQARELEKQQALAMKNIVGLDLSERKMREDLKIKTLHSRREKSVKKFATKCVNSERFTHWFPERRRPLYECVTFTDSYLRANIEFRNKACTRGRYYSCTVCISCYPYLYVYRHIYVRHVLAVALASLP